MAQVTGRPADMEIALVVRDLEMMTKFYREAVGLPHLYDFETHGVLMRRFACGNGAVFKLALLDQMPDESNPPGGLGGATGFRHLLIVIDDIEGAVRRCEAAGAKVKWPVQQFGESGPVISILEDPEGNSFELVARGSGSVNT